MTTTATAFRRQRRRPAARSSLPFELLPLALVLLPLLHAVLRPPKS